jgi:hypothetical protein
MHCFHLSSLCLLVGSPFLVSILSQFISGSVAVPGSGIVFFLDSGSNHDLGSTSRIRNTDFRFLVFTVGSVSHVLNPDQGRPKLARNKFMIKKSLTFCQGWNFLSVGRRRNVQ